MKNKNIFIGTSGWVYEDWWERFYPEDIRGSDRLLFYAQHFNTVEVNASFYRLPTHRFHGPGDQITTITQTMNLGFGHHA